MRPILVASDLTYRLAALDGKIAVKALAKVHLVGNELCTVAEPSTCRTTIASFVDVSLAVQPNVVEATHMLIRNETRMQCTIEKQVSGVRRRRARRCSRA